MAPTGIGEKFIIDEINQLNLIGNEIVAMPVRPSSEILHTEGKRINTYRQPLISFLLVFKAFLYFNRHPIKMSKLLAIIALNSHGLKNFVKNIIIIPKAINFNKYLTENNFHHLHAHWETTTSTIAYICNYLSGIPWSMSAHSGQILWNNMMKEKIRTASFCRVISEKRIEDVLKVSEYQYRNKLVMIHMGVRVEPSENLRIASHTTFRIICVANLDKIKGHKYLIEAVSQVHKTIPSVELYLVGDGKERFNIENQISSLGADAYIHLNGFVDNKEIITAYKEKYYDLMVLPSISIPEESREEGIPCSLMEAMQNGIPVISTNTGSISELIDDQVNGFLVQDKDAKALADKIIELINDDELRQFFINNGIKKIKTSFSVESTVEKLNTLFGNNGKENGV